MAGCHITEFLALHRTAGAAGELHLVTAEQRRSKMAFTNSREAMEALLSGYKFSSSDLERFVEIHQEEDQCLEYKDGKITDKSDRKEAIKVIRQAVSGFANSEGGVLIVGVSETPRKISACLPIGNEPLDKWVEGLLHDMAPFLSPLPRIHIVDYPSGPVVVTVVGRAPALVPCVEAGQLKYFLRLNQSTLRTPDFLLSDLILGRRQQPTLDAAVSFEQPPPLLREPKSNVKVHVAVDNVGLVTAETLDVGILSWVVNDAGPEINRHLLSYVEHPERVHVGGYDWGLRHLICSSRNPRTIKLSPFAKAVFEANSLLLLFSATQLEVTVAVYVIAKDSSPVWFECSFRCGRAAHTDKPYVESVVTKRVLNRRVQVKVEDISRRTANLAPAPDC